jgi:hypothetical protein
MTAPIVAATTAAERRIVRDLRSLGALSAATAQPVETRRRIERRRLSHLVRAGAVRETGSGRYYLDEVAYARYRRTRRYGILIAVTLVVAIGLVLYFGVAR